MALFKLSLSSYQFALIYLISPIIIIDFVYKTESTFAPSFVWTAVDKTLNEDRLSIVNANNEKVKLKGCAKVILYNKWSYSYLEGNHTGSDGIRVNVTHPENFASPEIVKQVKEQVDKINLGSCVPCIVIISIVNVSAMPQERKYGQQLYEMQMNKSLGSKYWDGESKIFQDYKLQVSQQFVKLLQFKTPIQARHLVLVRITEKKDDLTKCHGKRYTKYPNRLVSLWEQILFDHFKEARVIQGTIEEGAREDTLISGKETGIWVWMCEEINRRLNLEERCHNKNEKWKVGGEERCVMLEESGNFSTAHVNMTNRDVCGVYRART